MLHSPVCLKNVCLNAAVVHEMLCKQKSRGLYSYSCRAQLTTWELGLKFLIISNLVSNIIYFPCLLIGQSYQSCIKLLLVQITYFLQELLLLRNVFSWWTKRRFLLVKQPQEMQCARQGVDFFYLSKEPDSMNPLTGISSPFKLISKRLLIYSSSSSFARLSLRWSFCVSGYYFLNELINHFVLNNIRTLVAFSNIMFCLCNSPNPEDIHFTTT